MRVLFDAADQREGDGTLLVGSRCVSHTDTGIAVERESGTEWERDEVELRHLSQELRLAIEAALAGGMTAVAVALDTARNGLDSVIDDPQPRRSQVALARAKARLGLEAWRNLHH